MTSEEIPDTPTTPQSEAEAFAALLPQVGNVKCPTLMGAVADAILVELYRRRWEEGRLAQRKAWRQQMSTPPEWIGVCCISGVPIRWSARVRCFLMVRDEPRTDARDEAGYGHPQHERWLPVGLPLLGWHGGDILRAKDIAWRCLRTYFRQRYQLRLRPQRLGQQLAEATVGPKFIRHPERPDSEIRPWFNVSYALESAYRWLAHEQGKGTRETCARRSLRTMWAHWCRLRQDQIDPRLPFADRQNTEWFRALIGTHEGPRTSNDPYTEVSELYGLLPRINDGAVPFGLGSALHALLRGDRAALQALLDCKLAFDGLRELGLPLDPSRNGRLFSACEVRGKPSGLRGQLADWAHAQWQKLGAPSLE